MARGRVVVRGVELAGGVASEVFVYQGSPADDLALQLRSLGDALATRLADLTPTAVVVRAADHHSAARVTEAASLRLRAEGVLLATARGRVALVRCCSGREIGELCGESKAVVDARAAAILHSAVDATAAALAAERL